MAHDVFVSYSQKDKTTADAVVARLEHDGSRCWIAPRDIVPGTSWGEAIADAIAASRVMVLVLSANSNRSRQVIREVERAVAGDVIILPFRIDPVDPTGAMAYYLGTEHWLDAITPPMERHVERLSRTVRMLLSDQPLSREDLDAPPATVGRTRRRPSRAAVVAVVPAAIVLIGLVIALLFGKSVMEHGRPLPSASGSPDTGQASTVGLEEAGRYRPLDLDPTDLMAPMPITGFDIDGALLAYANGDDGVTLMSIVDPADPRPMLAYGIQAAQDVAISGDHLVALRGEYDPAVTILLSDGRGVIEAEISIDTDGPTSLYDIEVSDGHAYVSGHDYVGIIDMTVPSASRLVFGWSPQGSTGNPASVFVADGIGYFAAGWDGLYILDVNDPAAPTLLGHWPSPDWIIDLIVADDIAYLTLGDSGVFSLDVADPADPRLLGSVAVPGFAGSIDVAHGHAFVAWIGAGASMGGVAVVDMTDPATPALVNTYGRFPLLSDLEVADDHVFVSDESEGLIVFRMTDID